MNEPRRPSSPWRWAFLALLALLGWHLLRDVGTRDGFSWMDPYQYYLTARTVAEGADGMAGSVVATYYPWLLGQWLRIHTSIPFALSSHVLWLLALALGLALLARSLRTTAPLPLILLAIMAAPAFFGLSRELYLEFPLAALLTLHYALWFHRDRWSATVWYWPLFGLLMAAGFALKMTYPIFLIAPLLLDITAAARARAWSRAAGPALSLLAPPLLVMAATYLFFPASFRYYLTLGNTQFPPMRLIGPPESISAGALLFYVDQLFRNYLLLLSPLALLVIWYAVPRYQPGTPRRHLVDLWLWLAVPVIFFAFLPVREPRHIAACLIPLLLLTSLGITGLPSARWRRPALLALGLVAALQYTLVSRHVLDAPYRLDRPIRSEAILAELLQATPQAASFSPAPGRIDADRWRFTRSVLLAGFPPNEALALAWALNPGVVMTLDEFEDRRRIPLPHAYMAFTDPYLLNAFNLYNHRCGWRGYYQTLTRDQALAGADALLVVLRPGAPTPSYPGFRLTRSVEWGPALQVGLFTPEQPPAKSFRRLYAEEFLKRNPARPGPELNAIYQALLLDRFLRGQPPSTGDLAALFPPGFQPGGATREIYYLPVYHQLLARLNAALQGGPPPATAR